MRASGVKSARATSLDLDPAAAAAAGVYLHIGGTAGGIFSWPYIDSPHTKIRREKARRRATKRSDTAVRFTLKRKKSNSRWRRS